MDTLDPTDCRWGIFSEETKFKNCFNIYFSTSIFQHQIKSNMLWWIKTIRPTLDTQQKSHIVFIEMVLKCPHLTDDLREKHSNKMQVKTISNFHIMSWDFLQ